MTNSIEKTRRTFLGTALFGAAGALLPVSAAPQPDARPRICAFTKPFNKFSFGELADRIADLGFDGIEAPIRPGGHIEPAKTAQELPLLVEELSKRNLEIFVMATAITGMDDRYTKSVLETAAGLGLTKYRLGYYQYDLSRPVIDQIREIQPRLRDLVAYSSELGITPLYQNHCGAELVGAPVWDVYQLFTGLPAGKVGMAFDLAHATIEGGQCWPQHVNLMWPHMQAAYVKDFVWNGRDVKWVPLGMGHTDSSFYRQLLQRGFRGPFSLHVEYLDHESSQQQLAAFRQDLKQLRQWIQS